MQRTPVMRTAVLAGVLATATMDAAGAIARRAGMIPSDDIGTRRLGQWIGYMARGKFTHERLAREPDLPLEQPLGVLAHYLIGITLTGGYLALLRRRHAMPRLRTAVAYGTATAVFPWLIVYPAYGLGWFGLRADRPVLLLRANVGGHALFGLGIRLGTAAVALQARRVTRGRHGLSRLTGTER